MSGLISYLQILLCAVHALVVRQMDGSFIHIGKQRESDKLKWALLQGSNSFGNYIILQIFIHINQPTYSFPPVTKRLKIKALSISFSLYVLLSYTHSCAATSVHANFPTYPNMPNAIYQKTVFLVRGWSDKLFLSNASQVLGRFPHCRDLLLFAEEHQWLKVCIVLYNR